MFAICTDLEDQQLKTLCVWRNIRGVVHFEVAKPGQTVNSDFNCEQLDRVNRLIEKCPEIINRKDVDCDDVQELLDFFSQEMTIDEFIDMQEQAQEDIEELESIDRSSIRRSNDGWKFDGWPQFT
ncbi:hypothetical protein TNCV_4157141 [Trichonephila clavipes]|nr:hypothetical protein TNCV_4157141 [Trichonephila clavipes]